MCKIDTATVNKSFVVVVFIAWLATLAQAQSTVTEVFLKADDGRMSGPCPLKVVFHGFIRASGPGAVKYTFTRSDGASAPISILQFTEAGIKEVSTDWTLGDEHSLPTFSGWQAIKILSPNELESSHDTGAFSIACNANLGGTGEQTVTGNVSGTVKGTATGNPRSGNARQNGSVGVIPSVSSAPCYQVTLNGFTVSHATSDNALRGDGTGDEVYLYSPIALRVKNNEGVRVVSGVGQFGPVYGETGHGAYQGGSATPHGGFQDGDRFPTQTPWRRESLSPGVGIPYRFYGGPISASELLVIVPSLWEWDNDTGELEDYSTGAAYERMMRHLRNYLGVMLDHGYERFLNRELSGGRLPVIKTFSELGLESQLYMGLGPFSAGNRPIGMQLPHGQGDRAYFDPQVLFLTADAAENMSHDDRYRLGVGVIALRYRDDPDLQGDYTLYIETDRVACVGPNH